MAALWKPLSRSSRKRDADQSKERRPPGRRFRLSMRSWPSIPVMIRLERAFRLDADIVRLVLAQLGQLDAHLGEVQSRDLFVERLRQHVDLLRVFAVLVVGPQFDLGQRL